MLGEAVALAESEAETEPLSDGERLTDTDALKLGESEPDKLGLRLTLVEGVVEGLKDIELLGESEADTLLEGVKLILTDALTDGLRLADTDPERLGDRETLVEGVELALTDGVTDALKLTDVLGVDDAERLGEGLSETETETDGLLDTDTDGVEDADKDGLGEAETSSVPTLAHVALVLVPVFMYTF